MINLNSLPIVKQNIVKPALASLLAAAVLCSCNGAVEPGNPNNPGGGSSSSSSGGGNVSLPEAASPKAKTIHRLNKFEFENSVRDLLYGLDVEIGNGIPQDGQQYGFDNIVEIQSLTTKVLKLHDAEIDIAVKAAFADGARAADGTPLLNKLLLCNQNNLNRQCALDSAYKFARRAWRRSITADEKAALAQLVESASGDWKEGFSRSVHGSMLSPHFLFRVELDPTPEADEIHLLSDFELATRLSYFLWSTGPDEELLQAAEAGNLNNPDAIAAQVKRMMASPKALAIRENFFGQWLFTRLLQDTGTPLTKSDPDFTHELKESMITEINYMLDSVISGDRELRQMLLSETTHVDKRLADLYGIPGSFNNAFQEVSLVGTNRRGILTQAGIMSALAGADSTNPIFRGKWISEQMFCFEPPEPDEGMPVVPLDEQTQLVGAVRDRLAQHSTESTCFACHRFIDPGGLGLENFDAIGKWRDVELYQGVEYDIDATGTFALHGPFQNPPEMMQRIAESEDYLHCVAEKVYIYAMGRGMESDEEHTIDRLAAILKRDGETFPNLLEAIATSDAFRMAR